MDNGLVRKLDDLRKRIRKLDSALVAFSGGMDSSFLMRICREELGEKAVAVTALSSNYPAAELSLARRIARVIGARHIVYTPPEDGSRGCSPYPSMKCLAGGMKIKYVLDGSHMDDANEKGAMFKAARKSGVRSPLLESNLSKADIRLLAKELGLPNWEASPELEGESLRSAIGSAKRYIISLGVKGASVFVKVQDAHISAGKAGLSLMARHFDSVRRKMLTLGFSDAFLSIPVAKAAAKKSVKAKKPAKRRKIVRAS